MILDYQSNSLTTVEDIGQGLWRVWTRIDENLFSAEVRLDMAVPALDIRQAGVNVKRDVLGLTPDLSEKTDKLVGVRVGPGMTKIIRGIMGGAEGSDRIAELTLEAMEMLINSMTTPELRKAMVAGGIPADYDSDGPKVFLNETVIGGDAVKMMAGNPRLKDSCAAFRDL